MAALVRAPAEHAAPACGSSGDDLITFLYELQEGACPRSYGLQVCFCICPRPPSPDCWYVYPCLHVYCDAPSQPLWHAIMAVEMSVCALFFFLQVARLAGIPVPVVAAAEKAGARVEHRLQVGPAVHVVNQFLLKLCL